jgi:hypothetical protein
MGPACFAVIYKFLFVYVIAFFLKTRINLDNSSLYGFGFAMTSLSAGLLELLLTGFELSTVSSGSPR